MHNQSLIIKPTIYPLSGQTQLCLLQQHTSEASLATHHPTPDQDPQTAAYLTIDRCNYTYQSIYGNDTDGVSPSAGTACYKHLSFVLEQDPKPSLCIIRVENGILNHQCRAADTLIETFQW